MMKMTFRDKVVIVTGASSGIGKHLCLSLTAEGATVVGCARDQNNLESVYRETGDLPGKILCNPL